jgi:hypothetical protein
MINPNNALIKPDLGLIKKWLRYLDEPVSGASLAVFRICFSILMVVLVYEFFQSKWIDTLSGDRVFHFTYIHAISPWSGYGMHIHLIFLAVLALLMGIGFLYRPAAILFLFAFTYVFLLEKSLYQNHLYLVCLLSLLFSIVSANRVWSLDNLRQKPPDRVPRWNVLIFRFQFVIVYFFSGIAKLSSDWLQGYPQTGWLLDRAADPIFGPLFGPIFQEHWFVLFITYGGIAFDLSIGFLLCWRRTFWLGAGLVFIFHITNAAMFSIDIFPWLMIASIGLFADEDWPYKCLRALKINKDAFSPNAVACGKTSLVTLILVHVYVIVQLVVPLRRFLYPGDPSWTEQGQRFAWRMMLRDKRSAGFQMIFVDPRTGMKGIVHPENSLDSRQMEDMRVIPDMILQYAHYVAEDIERQLGARPIVRVQAKVSLNGRPAQDLIDRRTDLAAEKESFAPAKWILPLKTVTATTQP